MLRKMFVAFACMMVVVVSANAGLIGWDFGGDMNAFDTFSAGWSVRLFEDVGNDNDFTVDGYTFGANDTYVGEEQFLMAGKGGIIQYGGSFNSPGGTLALSDAVYTVVYNNADASLATQYIIIDTNPFDLPATDIDASYTLTTVSGTWQAVPEPTTMALLGIGLGAVAVVSRKRKGLSKKA